jgi:hypothetical protein
MKMTFIDWSDSECMFGLLVEFVADECKECIADEERGHFLRNLLRELTAIEERILAIPITQTIDTLKDVRDGISYDFTNDPVIVHIEACIEELERVRNDGTA